MEDKISSIRVDRYMIEGSIPRALWRFAIPFMCAYLLQAFYGAVDLFIIGRYCDEAAIAAVSIGAQFLFVVTGLTLGLATGSTALIAKQVGSKDSEGAARAIGSTAVLFFLISVVLTPILALSTDYFVEAMKTPTEAVDYTRQYVFTAACGIPLVIGYNVIGAIYRGFGDAVTPTIFVVVSCVCNIIGDLILIAHYGMGPLGAAIATVASIALSFVASIVYIRVKRFPIEFHRRHFLPNLESLKRILGVGAPLALQDVFTNVSFLIIQALVNSMGVMEAAGLGVAQRCIGFFFLPAVAFSNAVTTATAQNLGAKQPKRAASAGLWGTLIAATFGVVFWLSCQFLATNVAGLFTHVDEVARQGGLYLRSFMIDCVLVALIFNLNGYFCGCGKTLIVFLHSTITAFVARIPLSYLISRESDSTLFDVGLAAPLSSCLSVAVCVCVFLILRKKTLAVASPPNLSA